MTGKPNAVQAAIEAAKEQAQQRAANAPIEGQVIDTYAQTNQQTGLTTYQPAKIKTFEDLGGSGFDVDSYLSVNAYGLTVKGNDALFNQIKVSIDTSLKGIQGFEGIKYGNPVVYDKTYDGVKSVKGGSWQDVLRKVQTIEPSARTYEGADITMTVLEDVVANGAVIVKKGTILGHSTSTTNKANLIAFRNALTEAKLLNSVVEVLIKSEKKTNPKGQTWGVLEFSLIGEFAGE